MGRLSFQAPRHREMWRELTKVSRVPPAGGPADGAVVLDVGGIRVSTGRIREFLLRVLRVNPEGRYTASVLDAEREEEALEAIRKADLGVVFLVEGWALSPKEIKALHERVRTVGGHKMPVHFVVLGPVTEGEPAPPRNQEWTQWRDFVDSLRDPATDVVAYQRLPALT